MMKICVATALALALAHTGVAQVVCDGTTSCASQTFSTELSSPTATFVSSAANAAVQATVTLAAPNGGTTAASFLCEADNSCSGATFSSGSVTAGSVTLGCSAPHACENANAQFSSFSSATVDCGAAHSCNGLDITATSPQAGASTSVLCSDHESCSGATVRAAGKTEVTCSLESSCSSLTIDCVGPVDEFKVFCPNPEGCASLTFRPSCYNQVWTPKVEACYGRICRNPTTYTTQIAAPTSTVAVTTPVTTSGAVCDQLDSEWLTTEFMPTLDVVASGFEGLDTFRIAFDHHRKYFDVIPTLNAAGEQLTIAEHVSTTGQTPSQCWDHYCITATWGSIVANDNCHRESDTASSGFITYTCKLVVDSKETLDPIRTVSLSREVHNEIPYQVLFPKQTSASLGDISAFAPPNVLAALVRQEVDVQVSGLTVDVTVDLYTSIQWPFLLTGPTVVSTPAAIPALSFAIESPCADPDAGDQPGTGDDANACNQIWRLKLDPDNGARSAPCELDGTYQVEFTAVCQSSFPSDCPLVKDDLGAINDVFGVTFVLDSEYFCPVVVETVDLSADLFVYKDHVHNVPATNFILGQRAYFRFVADSTEVTIASVAIDDIEITGCATVAGQVYTDKTFPASALFPAAEVHIENSGSTFPAALTTPDYEAWFDFPISNPPFDAPVDGSCDFSVSATADVVFKNAALVALLGDAAPVRRSRYNMRLLQSDQRQQVASTTFAASEYDQDISAAPAMGSVAAAAALAAGAAIVA